LPHKLDAAEKKYLDTIEYEPRNEWDYTQKEEGETALGGEMRFTYKFKKSTTK
jgi:hypothetical protein